MINFFLLYSTPPPPHTLTDPPNAKCKFKRESCYFVRNHPLFSLPLEELWRLSWSPWKQHDFEGSPELLFKLNCSLKKTKKTNKSRTTQKSVLILFGICGGLSVSTATLLMQTECCLRLVHFLFFLFFWCIILSLRIGCSTVLQRVLFSQWPYSVLFYSMHKTVFVYLSMSLLCCGHD